jgi:hypothetical protein
MMDKVQKHNSFNTNTPLSESYKNDEVIIKVWWKWKKYKVVPVLN